jgi:type III restriction enzyme
MELKNYQKKAVDTLLTQTRQLLSKEGSRVCVFKAPTGSGKTIMVADFLNQLSQEPLGVEYAFIWVSGNNLHVQSRNKLERELKDSRYTLSYLDDVQDMELATNEILFVNWHSLTKKDRRTGEYINSYMRDQESGRTLQNFVSHTKENGKEIILIVDESHYHYWSDDTQDFVQTIIAPRLTIEVSATPKILPSQDEIVNLEKGYVLVKFQDVVDEGMIKSSVVINESLDKQAKLFGAKDELIVDAALAKQTELLKIYRDNKSEVRPLILIQLPSETASMSALDESKKEFLISYLAKQYDITVGNGRLAIWLSNEKANVDKISNNDDEVDVLIFKQAIALGWDCPRAQILIMFRDIRSVTFEIQTVGRILRMPEAMHYGDNEIDRAYVYTNLDRINIADNKTDRGYFKTKHSMRSETFKPIDIPSVYHSRIDYGDLTATFHKCFYAAANNYFEIKTNDMANEALRKADSRLELKPQELTKPVLVDAVIENIDNSIAAEIIGAGELQITVAENDIKLLFTIFAKATSLPYAPVRSHTKVQQSIYNWFDSYLAYKNKSRIDIQRIVVCSDKNLKIFKQIIEDAKDRFRIVDAEQKSLKRKRKDTPKWNPITHDYLSDNYIELECRNSLMQPLYIEPKPSEPEKDFMDMLKSSKIVSWWYRNGSNKESYLGIPYYSELNKRDDTFYPDFIVKYLDGSLGIYDTKKGITVQMDDTAEKADALHEYLFKSSRNDQKLVGGIVDTRSSGFFVFTGNKYSKDSTHKDWHRFVI